MRKLNKSILLILFLPVAAFCDEGYSSATLSSFANVYSRAFTIYTHVEACGKAPEVSEIEINYPKEIIKVGDRIQANSSDDSIVSDFIINAFDEDGNFLPSVPIFVYVNLPVSTLDSGPEVIYRDSSINYWEARKTGEFSIEVVWACQSDVLDRIIIEVVD